MNKQRVSRRRFLGTLAALPLAARFGPRTLFGNAPPRIAVVGAGAFGGWTALHLRNLGADVVLVDGRGPGNSRSSSGGRTRVIRAIYGADRIYSEMVKRAFDLWETLDAGADEQLYVETGALWMHQKDDSYVRASLPILEELGFRAEPLALPEAARRYPQISFRGIESVWLEHRAGALLAAQACVAVRDAFVKGGGTYRTAQVSTPQIANGSLASLRLADGSTIEADAYVFACGAWLGQVLPDVLGGAIRPTRQEVFYFRTPPGSNRYTAARLPVWVDFGERIVYGVPEADGRSLKVADDTRGAPIDPSSDPRVPSREGVERMRRFLARRFPELARARVTSAWVCQYENSPDGHLIVDRHPEASNVWIAGGGSGHGFKLAPVVGEIAASAIATEGAVPEIFRLERLRGLTAPKTQFERKDG